MKSQHLPVTVRVATAADMDSVQAIYSFYVTRTSASFEEVPPDRPEMERRLAKTLDRGLPFLVADAEGDVVGYTYAGPFRYRSAYRYTIEDSIYVAPSVTRRGVGAVLLGSLVHRCTELGYRQMIGVIGDSANKGSISLHRRLGFRQACPTTPSRACRCLSRVRMNAPSSAGRSLRSLGLRATMRAAPVGGYPIVIKLALPPAAAVLMLVDRSRSNPSSR